MQRQERTGTKPELAVRHLLLARGLRYRVDYKLPVQGVRRRCDHAFVGPRVAVFVDGCWWHRCPVHATTPSRTQTGGSRSWTRTLRATATPIGVLQTPAGLSSGPGSTRTRPRWPTGLSTSSGAGAGRGHRMQPRAGATALLPPSLVPSYAALPVRFSSQALPFAVMARVSGPVFST
ncbi:very short patch repair endonuclease [Nocardioides ungokensis]|uniref:very short patch repair endonuclease n=1 Tax=Nocardioides ungokensis TaxID=1643322 RepID=UPI001FECD883|nr:very short patch repair endonuclease [Nocardioides ungokensis]